TVWPAEPHTLAKHRILRQYLNAWLPILSAQLKKIRRHGRLLYVDGFAGPGVYEGNEEGSPVIAYKAVLESKIHVGVPIELLFVEEREDRCERLKVELKKAASQLPPNEKVTIDGPHSGRCAEELEKVLRRHAQTKKPLGPALFFLDQFGYSDIPIELI